jgi:hypothetical protein
MCEGNEGSRYKQYAERTYAYYKERGVMGIVDDGWQWLIGKPERLTALSTFAIFLATAVMVGVGLAQWTAIRGQLDIAKRALVAVERPIIFVSLPSKFEFVVGQPPVAIKVENIGKQLASVLYATATFILQKETLPPVPLTEWRDDGSSCVIDLPNGSYLIGELVLRPTDSKDLQCIRQRPLSGIDINSLIQRNLFGFFRFILSYSDPIGSTRTAVWMFLLRPSGQFAQVYNVEETNRETADPNAQNERVLTDEFLRLETEKFRKATGQPSH